MYTVRNAFVVRKAVQNVKMRNNAPFVKMAIIYSITSKIWIVNHVSQDATNVMADQLNVPNVQTDIISKKHMKKMDKHLFDAHNVQLTVKHAKMNQDH